MPSTSHLGMATMAPINTVMTGGWLMIVLSTWKGFCRDISLYPPIRTWLTQVTSGHRLNQTWHSWTGGFPASQRLTLSMIFQIMMGFTTDNLMVHDGINHRSSCGDISSWVKWMKPIISRRSNRIKDVLCRGYLIACGIWWKYSWDTTWLYIYIYIYYIHI